MEAGAEGPASREADGDPVPVRGRILARDQQEPGSDLERAAGRKGGMGGRTHLISQISDLR